MLTSHCVDFVYKRSNKVMLSNVTCSGIEELLTYFNPSWWVYTRVKVLETQGPKHPFINHIFVLKIEPKLQD